MLMHHRVMQLFTEGIFVSSFTFHTTS